MNINDLDSVLKIESKRDIHHWTKTQFESELAVAHAHCIVGIHEGENESVIGFAIGHDLGLEYELLLIVVDQAIQRQGVGKLLLDEQCLWARKSGAEKFFLEFKKSNHPAQTLYKTSGFEVCGERKGYYKNGETAVIMQCML